MKDAAEPASPSASTRSAALLDYYGAPGKYQLTLRQPALLFASIRDLLQIAAGRGAAEGADGQRLRDAAHFFIRAALLYPGADHYAVMGLASGETATDLKERYRLLMRLIHPDFAQDRPADWPADAATRVNRAYEVLSSPVLRREYDEQLATLRTQRPAAVAKPVFQAARRSEERAPRIGKKAAWVFGVGVGIPAILLLMPRQEPDQLVQRASPSASAQGAAAVVAAEAQSAPALVSSQRLPPAGAAPAAPTPAPAPVANSAPAPVPPAVAVAAPAPVALPVPAAAPAPAAPPVARVAPPAPAVVAQARPAPAPAPLPVPAPAVQRPAPAVVAASVVTATAPVPARAVTIVVADDPAPAPAAPVASVPAPVIAAAVQAPAATSSPSTPPAGRMTTTLAIAAVPAPTLADAQPLLSQVLQVLESGSGDQLLRLLDTDARNKPGALALSRQYEQMVKGGKPVRLSQVEFNGESRDSGVLLVTGRIRLHTGEPTIGAYGQRLLLRAEFAQRAGKVQLTGLSGSTD